MTNALPSAVSAEITLRMVVDLDRSIEVPCSLEYRAEEPYAVFATFRTGMADIEWTFARDLIRDGLSRPSGEGDVVIWPESSGPVPVVLLALNSPSGQALLEVDAHLIETFLTRTYDIVAAGSESMQVDVDRWIAQILEEGVNEF
jgi:hypothetical protein